MAIFHLHAQYIGRSGGRSAVAASAYRSGSQLTEQSVDSSTGYVFEKSHDYRHKNGVVFSEVIVPEEHAEWMQDREELWNRVQNNFDTRKNSVFSHEKEISLPVELTLEQNLELLKDYVSEAFTKEGIIADVNVHYDNKENPHVHIMHSTREIVWDSDVGQSGEYTFGKKNRYWDSKEFLVNARRLWAQKINDHLKLQGFEKEISHLSYKELGIDLVPGIKEGAGRRIEGSERSQMNDDIGKANRERILKNPELIIDVLRKDKVVFTKEDISTALMSYVREDLHVGDSKAGRGSGLSKDSKKFGIDIPNADDEMKSVGKYISALNKVLDSDRLVAIGSKDLDGRIIYTSRMRHELEQDLGRVMSDLKESGLGQEGVNHALGVSMDEIGKKGAVGRVLDKLSAKGGFVLSDQQKNVVSEIVNGGPVSVVEGLPGSGKTSVMNEVVRQYRKAGYDVIGSAVSSAAAVELGEKAGINALNLTKFRYESEKLRGMIGNGNDFNVNLRINYYKDYFDNVSEEDRSKSLLSDKSVLIVDEASMLDLTQLHFVKSEVRRAGAKLILLGDRSQCTSVGIAGGFEKSADEFGISRLDEVRRQRDPEHRRATELLSDYKVSDAIRVYKDKSVFDIAPSIEEARERLVKDYISDFSANVNQAGYMDKTIMALAYTNEDVGILNNSIRGGLKDSGVIYGKEFEFKRSSGAIVSLSMGDRIVFDKNSSWMDVSNGDTGRIVGFGSKEDKHGARETLVVRLDREEKYLGVSVPIDVEVDNHFYKGVSYGFAVTVNKSQGATYNSTYGLLREQVGYNAYLVMCTRHMDSLKVYASGRELEDVLLKRVDLDVERARKEWNLYADEGRGSDIHFAGISAIAYKRGDRSLSDDYKQESFKEPREVVAKYLEVRSEALKLNNTIWQWLSSERLKERYGKSDIAKEKEAEFKKLQAKGEIVQDKKWEGLDRHHHPLYPDLEDLLGDRAKSALKIYNNSKEYSKVLTQSNINFATVQKHALMPGFDFKLRKALPDGKVFGQYEDNKKLHDLLGSLEQLSKYEVGSLFERGDVLKGGELLREKIGLLSGELLKSYEERRLDIEALSIEREKTRQGISEGEYKLIRAKEYCEVSIVKFFEKTYKEDHGVILDRWNSIKDKHLPKDKSDPIDLDKVLEQSLAEVRSKPQILGGLKGRGLGAALAFTPTRFRATVNLEVVADRLEKYEHAKHEIAQITELNKIASANHSDILVKIKDIKRGLVGSDLEHFIGEVSKFAGHIQNSDEQGGSALKNAILWSKRPLNREKIGLFQEIMDSSKQFKKQGIDNAKLKTSSVSKVSSSISFDEVVSKLGVVEHESIFRKYVTSLNPSDAVERNGDKITCGTINMNLKTGLWHRFSTGEGGNIFSLVREAEGCNKYESLLRVASDIGVSSGASFASKKKRDLAPKDPIRDRAAGQSSKNEWVPYNSIAKTVPLFKAEVHLKYMLKDNDIGAVHDYKDNEGNIIGHTVRVISKDNGSKKVLPVAYCHNEALGKDSWRLKGFTDNKGGKPIYGLEKIYYSSEKDKPVLIVEGEKTADHAQQLLPEYRVISWLGGSQNASKVDWGHLKGRNVAIWPDNDDVGIKCGKVIASNIKSLGSDDTRVWVVNPNNLGKNDNGKDRVLPNKWDLADELPEELSLEEIRGAISTALGGKHTKVQIVSGQFKSIEVAKRIEASQNLLGYSVSKVELEQLCTNHERLEAILTSNELKEYIRYTSTKGEFEPQHEFMNLDNKLYREALISIGMSDKNLDIEGRESRPSEVLTKIEEKHQSRVQSFSDHLDVNKDYSKVLDSSGSSSDAKAGLFNTLSRDVMLLHKLQLEEFLGKGEVILTEHHKEIVTSTIYDLVKEAKVGSRGDISAQEMQEIADKAYLKLCEESFWTDMSDRPLETEQLKEKALDKTQKTINIDHILQGLQEISGEQRIQVLNEQISRMPNHLRRDFVVGSLVSDMESKFLHKFDEINLSKEGAQNIASLASAICQEQELLQSVVKDYSNLAVLMQDIAPNAKLSKLLSQSPQAQEVQNLVLEAQALEHFGLKLDQSEFESLKQSSDLSEVVSDLNDRNLNHVIEVAASDIGAIAKDGFIELQEDVRFSSPASYLEYKIQDKVFGQYLSQTNIPELVEDLGARFGEAIDELGHLDPESNIGKIEAKLCIPDLDQRLEIIEKELAHTFDGKVGEYLVGFNNAKSESEDIDELVEHISKEHEFVDMLSDKYPNAVEAFEKVYADHQLGKIQVLSEGQTDFIENMLQDLSTLDRLGFEIDEQEFESIKSDTNAEVGEKLFNLAKDHVLEMVHDNAHELRFEDHVEEHGMTFTNRLAYIRHEVYENNFERYLEGSEFEKEIKSMERYCEHHDMSQEEYMEMDHNKNLDKGMER